MVTIFLAPVWEEDKVKALNHEAVWRTKISENGKVKNSKWGVKDMEGDGTDSMFTHIDISTDEVESNNIASIKESKKEFDDAADKK